MQRLAGHACRDTIYLDLTVRSSQQKIEKLVLEFAKCSLVLCNKQEEVAEDISFNALV
jgi:hypothetical protein